VLAAGGAQDAIHAISGVELYDPGTEIWTPGGSMNTARASYAATLLPDGKVLVTGGFGADFQALAGAELYDPATGIWTNTGSMIVRRFDHAAAQLLARKQSARLQRCRLPHGLFPNLEYR